ncbi:hypothetical protein FQA39_LY08415 [Lamprigera yunnana]|nr:hypothetical protein FQA39_LY08415 [Lamprigera yunnana]
MTSKEIDEAIGTLKKGKAARHDNITTKMVKNMDNKGREILRRLFNEVMSQRPEDWKLEIKKEMIKNLQIIKDLQSQGIVLWFQFREEREREERERKEREREQREREETEKEEREREEREREKREREEREREESESEESKPLTLQDVLGIAHVNIDLLSKSQS